MPTYDYECLKCGYTFELFQKMTDEPLKKCPQCGGKKVKRLIGSGMGIIFKGSGFYETDYKRKQDKKAPKQRTGEDDKSTGDLSTGKKPQKENTSCDTKDMTKPKKVYSIIHFYGSMYFATCK